MIEVRSRKYGNEIKIDRFEIAEIIAKNFGVNIRDVSIVIENGWTVAYIKTDKKNKTSKEEDAFDLALSIFGIPASIKKEMKNENR